MVFFNKLKKENIELKKRLSNMESNYNMLRRKQYSNIVLGQALTDEYGEFEMKLEQYDGLKQKLNDAIETLRYLSTAQCDIKKEIKECLERITIKEELK